MESWNWVYTGLYVPSQGSFTDSYDTIFVSCIMHGQLVNRAIRDIWRNDYVYTSILYGTRALMGLLGMSHLRTRAILELAPTTLPSPPYHPRLSTMK